MNPVRLVARREFTERVRERSFMISTGITLAIVVLVVVLPSALGLGGPTDYTVNPSSPRDLAVAEARDRRSTSPFDANVTIGDSNPDVTLDDGVIVSDEPPDDDLVRPPAGRQPAGRRARRAAAAGAQSTSPRTRTRTPRPRWPSSRS